MTREEAIRWLKVINKKEFGWDEFALQESQREIRERCEQCVREAIDMAIEALSQPIVAKCYEMEKDRIYCSPEVADKVFNVLHEDTNVQNLHKGKWIKKQVFNPELDKYVPLIECSVCGYEPYFGGSESEFNYCANCGATMKGADNEIDRCRCTIKSIE